MPREPRRLPHTYASRRHLTFLPLALLFAALLPAAPAEALTVRKVTVTPVGAQMQIAQARQFQAFAEFSDSSVREITTTAEWTTGSSRIAIVSTNPGSIGIVTAVGAGTVKISAAITIDGDKTKGSVDLVVVTPPLASITTKPTTKKLEIGVDTQFKATATYVNEFTADVTETAPGVPANAASCSSKVRTQGPVVSQSLPRTSTTAATSWSSTDWRP